MYTDAGRRGCSMFTNICITVLVWPNDNQFHKATVYLVHRPPCLASSSSSNGAARGSTTAAMIAVCTNQPISPRNSATSLQPTVYFHIQPMLHTIRKCSAITSTSHCPVIQYDTIRWTIFTSTQKVMSSHLNLP